MRAKVKKGNERLVVTPVEKEGSLWLNVRVATSMPADALVWLQVNWGQQKQKEVVGTRYVRTDQDGVAEFVIPGQLVPKLSLKVGGDGWEPKEFNFDMSLKASRCM
jgi:hypothetical protein